jgi:FtsP/CotA-like multicopper oxidase with cupredoxin domain
MTHPFKTLGRLCGVLLLGAAALLPGQAAQAAHDIRGITGPDFRLYAFPFYMTLPEGTSLYMWGFGDLNRGATATHPEGTPYALPQYPAPTLIVTEGQDVTIELTNYGVPDPVSIVVAGHQVTATGGAPGLVTQASSNGTQTVTYSFTAGKPGTYIYHSLDGQNPGLHQEMGLAGALIVRPGDGSRSVYGAGTGTDYDQEFLYLLTEIDPDIHIEMAGGHRGHFTYNDRYATAWFVNGRPFPDFFQADYTPLFPNQPYAGSAAAHPGDVVLVRAVNVGQDSHPFHFHGENMQLIGRDGRMLSSDGLVTNLGRTDNTLNMAPKQTTDMLWSWTGKALNWDIYGPVSTTCTDDGSVAGSIANNMADDAAEALGNLVMCHDDFCNDGNGDGFDDVNHEYCADHGKPLPVTLPGVGDITVGGWWSGSPFLGDVGDLPPGEGGLNPFGGYFLVWHSHAEKELTTFNIFPGGTLSAVAVLPPYVDIY